MALKDCVRSLISSSQYTGALGIDTWNPGGYIQGHANLVTAPTMMELDLGVSPKYETIHTFQLETQGPF